MKTPSLKMTDASIAVNNIKPQIEHSKSIENVAFTYEQLVSSWNKLTDKFQQDGKMGVYTIITLTEPRLVSDSRIEITVYDKFQADTIETERLNILTFLKKDLRNANINLISIMASTDEQPKKGLYSPTDKFNFLAEKNPMLIELRKRLDLFLDF
jgi:DNA polymerase-3 subunit gamma/tau